MVIRPLRLLKLLTVVTPLAFQHCLRPTTLEQFLMLVEAQLLRHWQTIPKFNHLMQATIPSISWSMHSPILRPITLIAQLVMLVLMVLLQLIRTVVLTLPQITHRQLEEIHRLQRHLPQQIQLQLLLMWTQRVMRLIVKATTLVKQLN